MKTPAFLLTSFLGAAALIFADDARAEIGVKSGDKIGFLGDSITQQGWNSPGGYVKLVMSGLTANGVTAEAIPAGISGHKSNQMLERLETSVLSKKPQWMTLSCGVNDVWHGKKGVPLDDAANAAGEYEYKEGENRGTYKKNITAIVDRAQAAGVKVVILTSTVIFEKLDSPENIKLAPYNDFLRQLATEKKAGLADLSAMFHERLKAENKPDKKVLTGDGVHMNSEGNQLMAIGVLKAFGLNDAQVNKAKAAWATETAARAAATPAPAPAPK